MNWLCWLPRRGLGALLAVTLAVSLAGCGGSAGEGGPSGAPIRILVIPTQGAGEFEAAMEKLERELSQRSGLRVEVRIGTDYASVVEALRFGKADVGFFGPFTYVVAHAQSGVRAFVTQTVDGKPYYHSYLIVPRDSEIPELKTAEDFVRHVKGKRVAFADPGSTSGSLIPRLALRRAGLDWERDIQYTFTGHHDAVLTAVAGGKADIGAIDSAIFTGQLSKTLPEAYAKVRVVWQSEPLYQYPWAARPDLDPQVVQKLQQAFLEIQDPEILRAFGADGFVAAEDRLYDPIREAAAAMGIDLKAYDLKGK
ncbi:MAG: phosphate/phosphite/phosphonate ABC transporter substrate-binding protein [Bacillota bacterium]